MNRGKSMNNKQNGGHLFNPLGKESMRNGFANMIGGVFSMGNTNFDS